MKLFGKIARRLRRLSRHKSLVDLSVDCEPQQTYLLADRWCSSPGAGRDGRKLSDEEYTYETMSCDLDNEQRLVSANSTSAAHPAFVTRGAGGTRDGKCGVYMQESEHTYDPYNTYPVPAGQAVHPTANLASKNDQSISGLKNNQQQQQQQRTANRAISQNKSPVPAVRRSLMPLRMPQQQPTVEPRQQPTEEPQQQPTVKPQQQPTVEPQQQPTVKPQQQPTEEPQQQPTEEPQQQPTEEPQQQPTEEAQQQPTVEPRQQPTEEPQQQPTVKPQQQPTVEPQQQPTVEPQQQPTVEPQQQPTVEPQQQPTEEPQQPTEEPQQQQQQSRQLQPAEDTYRQSHAPDQRSQQPPKAAVRASLLTTAAAERQVAVKPQSIAGSTTDQRRHARQELPSSSKQRSCTSRTVVPCAEKSAASPRSIGYGRRQSGPVNVIGNGNVLRIQTAALSQLFN